MGVVESEIAKKTEKGFFKKAWGNKPWAVMNIFNTVTSYNDHRSEGEGRIRSAASAGIEFVGWEMIGGGAFIPIQLAELLPSAAVHVGETLDRTARQMNNVNRNIPFMNSHFYDTRQGYTMRQQGMALAKNSRYQLEQTLMGNEAQYLKK